MATKPTRGFYTRRAQAEVATLEKNEAEAEQHNPQITGTWSSPETDSITVPADEALGDTEEDIAPEPVKTSKFVRVVHNQVGMYPQGSVLPASAFEYLSNLIKLGAVVYDYEATEQIITGDAQNLASVTGVISAAMRTIPTAPWATAAAHNLLGAHYVSLLSTQRPWIPPVTHQEIPNV